MVVKNVNWEMERPSFELEAKFHGANRHLSINVVVSIWSFDTLLRL